jgi:hypothetical protein
VAERRRGLRIPVFSDRLGVLFDVRPLAAISTQFVWDI